MHFITLKFTILALISLGSVFPVSVLADDSCDKFIFDREGRVIFMDEYEYSESIDTLKACDIYRFPVYLHDLVKAELNELDVINYALHKVTLSHGHYSVRVLTEKDFGELEIDSLNISRIAIPNEIEECIQITGGNVGALCSSAVGWLDNNGIRYETLFDSIVIQMPDGSEDMVFY